MKLGLYVGNYGLEETLDFHVLDIDQASDETAKEANDNLQLEGHVGMGMVLPCTDHHCGAYYAMGERPPWRPNAFSRGNCGINVALLVSSKIHSWSRSGLSPWRCELNKRLLGTYSHRQSDEKTLCEFITPIVEFDFSENLAMGRDYLDGEKIIFDADHIANQVIFQDNVMLHGPKSQVQSKTAVKSRICANSDIEKMSEVSEFKKLQVCLYNSEVFDERHNNVVLDSEMQSDMDTCESLLLVLDSHDNLLQLVAQHAECPAGEDSYSVAEPSISIIVMTTNGDAMEQFDDMHHNRSDDMWDEEILHGFGLLDCSLQQLALGRKYRDDEWIVLHGMSRGELWCADMHVGERKIDLYGMKIFPQIFQVLLLCEHQQKRLTSIYQLPIWRSA